MSEPLASIILAAGLGTRMRSARAKVLHELAGEPMIARALRAHAEAGASALIVDVANPAPRGEGAARPAGVSSELVFASQADQRGTGDAARCGIEKLDP